MGEDGEEEVALDVIVREGIFVEYFGILTRGHVFLQGILLVVGLHVEIGQTIERWHLEDEASAFGLLHGAYEMVVIRHLSLHHHLMLEIAVIDADIVVGRGQVAVDDGGRSCGACRFRLVARGIAFAVVGNVVSQALVFLGVAGENAVLPVGDLVVASLEIAYGDDIQHLIDGTFDGQRRLWLVTHRTIGLGQLLPFVLAPALYHHQQVEVVTVHVVVGLEVIGWMGDEAAQLARKQQVGHQVAVVVRGLVGVPVANGERESSGLADTMQLYGQVDALIGCVGVCALDGSRDEERVMLVVVNEAETVGKNLPVAVEEGDVGYA